MPHSEEGSHYFPLEDSPALLGHFYRQIQVRITFSGFLLAPYLHLQTENIACRAHRSLPTADFDAPPIPFIVTEFSTSGARRLLSSTLLLTITRSIVERQFRSGQRPLCLTLALTR